MSLQKNIIELLRKNEEGLTTNQICTQLNVEKKAVQQSMRRLREYCVYIDHWTIPRNIKRPTAVFCLAYLPPDCPSPDEKT